MTRSFYSSAILFTVVHMAIGFFHAVLFFITGARLYDLPSIAAWILLVFGVSVAWSGVLLKYYHHKRYSLAFWTLAASIVASLFQFYLFYELMATREIRVSYVVAAFAAPVTGIIYAASLIFSAAGERRWLKISGVATLVLAVAVLASFALALVSVSARVNGTSEKFEQWISLAGSLIPVFFVLNFRAERIAAKADASPPKPWFENIAGLTLFVVLITGLILGPRLVAESFRSPDGPESLSNELKGAAQAFEPRSYVNARGDSLPYRLMRPLDFDSTRLYPLVVCLHGSSAVGSDNVRQVAATLPAMMLSTGGNRKKFPAFLFVPQCPRGFGWGGLADHPSVDALVLEAIAALEKEFPIDPRRRYVTGYSMGGYGTWHFIFTRPELFAAAVPMCGGGDPSLAGNAVGIPVWAFHGAKDMNVSVEGTRAIIAAMKEAGGHPRYTEFPDAAHNIWPEVMRTSELPEWLFAQKRDSIR